MYHQFNKTTIKNKLKIIFGILVLVIAVWGFFAVKWVKENNQSENEIGEEYIPH